MSSSGNEEALYSIDIYFMGDLAQRGHQSLAVNSSSRALIQQKLDN